MGMKTGYCLLMKRNNGSSFCRAAILESYCQSNSQCTEA